MNAIHYQSYEKGKKETPHSYKGWLNSDEFVKRAFAILGYQTVAALIIYAVFLVLILIILLFVGIGAFFLI